MPSSPSRAWRRLLMGLMLPMALLIGFAGPAEADHKRGAGRPAWAGPPPWAGPGAERWHRRFERYAHKGGRHHDYYGGRRHDHDERYHRDERRHHYEHHGRHKHPKARRHSHHPKYHGHRHRPRVVVVQPSHPYWKLDGDAARWFAVTAITLKVLDILSDHERHAYAEARDRALSAPVGETIHWNEGRGEGWIRVLRDGRSSAGRYCREFREAVRIGRERERALGTACRDAEGSWELVVRR